MPPERNEAAATAPEQELRITRVFNAPRHQVFAAWTDSRQIRQWSAPHGFVITHCEGDARKGGHWRCCMRTPEGAELWLGGVYHEVIEDQRLVFTHAWDDEDGKPGRETLVTVQFEDADGGTRMHFHQAGFDSTSSRDGHRSGWNECFERLAHGLSAQA